jgi:biopolymer transport protein ExbD
MTLEKGFLRKAPLPSLTKKEIWIGLILGACFAVVTYVFWFYLFETIRIAGGERHQSLYVFTEQEMAFYKWFYTSIALILGQSICFGYWVARSRRNKKLSFSVRLRLNNIYNNISAASTVFAHWFLICAFGYASYFGLALPENVYGSVDFYQNYKYLFILLPVWLWFASWPNIWRLFRSKSLKWTLLSALTIVTASYALSQWNVINYNATNTRVVNHDILTQYEFDLPYYKNFEKLEKRSRVIRFYIGLDKKDLQKEPTILYRNKNLGTEQIPLDQFANALWNLMEKYDKQEVPYLYALLVADKRVSLGYIYRLKNKILRTGMNKIAFATAIETVPYERRTTPNSYLGVHMYMHYPDSIHFLEGVNLPPLPPAPCVTCHTNPIYVHLSTDGSISLSNKTIQVTKLASALMVQLKKDKDYIILYTYDMDCNLGEYLTIYSEIYGSVDALRNELSLAKFAKPFKKLWEGEEEYNIVKRAFPMRIVEQ